LQQKTELQEAIDELWELMRIVKKSYNRGKKEVHCGVDWRVKNDEGKDSGVLHAQSVEAWKLAAGGKMKIEDS
jgi:hypothetical protein